MSWITSGQSPWEATSGPWIISRSSAGDATGSKPPGIWEESHAGSDIIAGEWLTTMAITGRSCFFKKEFPCTERVSPQNPSPPAGECFSKSTSRKRSGRLPDLAMRMIETEKLTHFANFEAIETIEDLETVSEETIWQNFERLAAFIFEKNDFRVTVNTVKTCNKNRRQYDVIARKSSQTFLVECKKWAGNRYRLSALKKAVEQHKERTAFYKTITHEDAVPVLVTLIEEEIRIYEGVPLVCILKLNSFINELEKDPDGYPFCDCEEDMPFPDDLLTQSCEFSRDI
jgi:hypothetical protein